MTLSSQISISLLVFYLNTLNTFGLISMRHMRTSYSSVVTKDSMTMCHAAANKYKKKEV